MSTSNDIFDSWFKEQFAKKQAVETPTLELRTQFTYREAETENDYPRSVTCAVCKFIMYGPPPIKSHDIMRFSHIDKENIMEEDGRCFIVPSNHKKCKELFALSPFAYIQDSETRL